MNAVVLTSVLSAGNHALFAGTRVLYGEDNFLSAFQHDLTLAPRALYHGTPPSSQDILVDHIPRNTYASAAFDEQYQRAVFDE